jgi:hypothetical protein
MSRARATDTEKAYWKKVGAANALLESESAPATSMEEVFERMESIRRRLGSLAAPGLPPDDDLAIAENLKIRARFRERERRGT